MPTTFCASQWPCGSVLLVLLAPWPLEKGNIFFEILASLLAKRHLALADEHAAQLGVPSFDCMQFESLTAG